MSNENILKFCFKGDRTYVQGPDIFNGFVNHFKGKLMNNLEMSFHSLTGSNLIVVSDESKLGDAKIMATISCHLDYHRNMYLVESEEKVNCKKDYDESQIIDMTKIDIENKCIALHGNSSYTFIEDVVALNKRLLTELFKEEVSGKWLFTKIRIMEMGALPDYEYTKMLTVKFKRHLNYKLTDSSILVNGNHVGNIYFTLV